MLECFNSIKVRLELNNPEGHNFFELRFNSIKVRLEQFIKLYEFLEFEFQFHKGAIRTPMLE